MIGISRYFREKRLFRSSSMQTVQLILIFRLISKNINNSIYTYTHTELLQQDIWRKLSFNTQFKVVSTMWEFTQTNQATMPSHNFLFSIIIIFLNIILYLYLDYSTNLILLIFLVYKKINFIINFILFYKIFHYVFIIII